RLLGIFGRHRIAVDAVTSEDPMGTQIRALRARLFLKLTGKYLIEPSLDDLSKKTDLSGLTDNLSPSRRLARRDSQ
ncbi:MAG: hypothetical protein EAX95_11695, partial [Candidatus Thorarchaeota archaeon]|nr:hypothetical protein [Candidatus Thorarchaeota archaeon]